MKPHTITEAKTDILALQGYNSSQKIKALVDILRIVAKHKDIMTQKLFIPDECQNFGFCEGYHEIGTLLYFLADMLEE